MAFVRLFQTGFEYRIGAEYVITTGNGSPNIQDDFVHTGNLSLIGGSDRVNFPMGKMVDQLRSNWFAYNTGTGSGSVAIVYGIKAEAEVRVRFLFNDSTDVFEVAINEVIQVEVPGIGVGWDANTWIAVGVTAKAGENGWVSLYLNGELIFRLDGYHFDDGEIATVGTSSVSHIDDVYVDECTAGEADSAPSSPRFYPIQVLANGENDEWQPEGVENSKFAVRNFFDTNGDMQGNLNAVVPFLYAGAADLKTDWSFPAPATDERIRAIIPYAVAHKGRAELDTQLRFIAIDGGVQLNGPDLDLPSAAYIVWHRFPLDANGDPWTYAALVRSTFGVESRGEF